MHKVQYSDLYADTPEAARKVISFLTGAQEEVDDDRLTRAVDRFTDGFSRYVGERPIKKARDIRDFRYFDENLYQMEETLNADYLVPLDIARLPSGDTA